MAGQSNLSPQRRRKRRLALLLYLALLPVLLLLLGEVGARLLGHKPYQVVDLGIKIEPRGRLFQPHPALGYTQLPGRFTVTLRDGYSFTVTHLTNTLRATHSPGAPTNRPAIWVMGCSFVHGWSLNDEETMPWQLQTLLPAYEIHNFGVNGYGTLHSFLQFQEFRKTMPKPACVVVNYAWFHDQRTTLTRGWRKAVVPYNRLGPVALPWVRLDKHIRRTVVEYHEWPLQRYSAQVHLLEQRYCDLDERRAHGHEVTVAWLEVFARQCRQEGIEFVVAGITRGKDTERVLNACSAAGIRTVDISVNLSEKENRNLPHDDHPSARAQKEYARKLAEFLKTTASP